MYGEIMFTVLYASQAIYRESGKKNVNLLDFARSNHHPKSIFRLNNDNWMVKKNQLCDA